jgi:phosphatidylglycerol:prolipoprotein diacylglycerol transferase
VHPIAFELFGFPVPSYSVLMVLGYAAALAVLWRLVPAGPGEIDDGGLHRVQVWDLFVVMVVSSVLGSKVGHVLFEADGHLDAAGRPTIHGVIDLLRSDPWHWARIGESGYVWYGGLLGALGAAVVYFRRRPKLSGWLYADTFAPAIVAGASIGRIGCFLAGCCYGKPTALPWGVRFPDLPGPVHPTQLYDSAAALLLFLLLGWRYPRRRFDGENIALLLIGYSALRAMTEAFRGDSDRGGIGPLSTSQLISIPLFLAGSAIYLSRRRATQAPAGVEPLDGCTPKPVSR